jgi:2-keto-4-pentenoate hydratase/2-oxohepta-3-ene-1,7-dioic acid hydratase in catechol pathway
MSTIPGISEYSIGTIYCIGRNYQKHARELGNSVPDTPLVFLKPVSSIISDRETIRLPAQSQEIHHEVELVIAVGQKGRNISRHDARKYIAGFGIGIDVTARDIQLKAKKAGHPWSIAKGFDTFAPVSSFKQFKDEIDLNSLQLSLHVNNELRQKGNTGDMIFCVDELIAYLSAIFTLQPGDLIFTGTPEGVSELHAGDTIQAELSGSNIQLTLSSSVTRDTP